MKTPRIYIGALTVFCIAALVIGTSGAAAITQQGTGNNLEVMKGHFGPEKMLDNLTAQGYDVSAISAAVTSGDFKTAQTLLQEFRVAHPDAFPACNQRASRGPMTGVAMGNRMLPMLSNLTAQGYDVSAISTAVSNGDYKTAQTLLQEFRTTHPDAFPARVTGTGKGPMTGQAMGNRMLPMLSNLTAQGYDVSAISAAVTSGDFKTAQTLLQEFRTAHPDAFPAYGARTGSGHLGWQRRA